MFLSMHRQVALNFEVYVLRSLRLPNRRRRAGPPERRPQSKGDRKTMRRSPAVLLIYPILAAKKKEEMNKAFLLARGFEPDDFNGQHLCCISVHEFFV